MFALAIDGEYKGQVETIQIQKILQDRAIEAKIEIASFVPAKGWVSVCLDKFATLGMSG